MNWKLLWQFVFIFSLLMFVIMFIKFAYSGYKDLKEMLKKHE